MRVLIDACVDPRVAGLLTGHQAQTAHELGWHLLKDRDLLRQVSGRFDVLLTIDRGIEFEHNLKALRLGVIVLHVEKNKVEFYRPLAAQILSAIERIAAGEVAHVPPEPLS